MKIVIRAVLLVVAWYVLFDFAALYGGIWHQRAHPTEGVRVQLRDGPEVEGSLSRSWNRQWVLTLGDGAVIEFHPDAALMMTFQKPEVPASFAHAWRSWGPVVLVCSLFTVALAWPWLREGVRHAVRQPF